MIYGIEKSCTNTRYYEVEAESEEQAMEYVEDNPNLYDDEEISEKCRITPSSGDCRYDVYLYECDSEGNVNDETAVHYATDDLKSALHNAAIFYRTKQYPPTINIYDNEIADYIVEWC